MLTANTMAGKVTLDHIKTEIINSYINDNLVFEYNKNRKVMYVIKEKDKIVEAVKFVDKDELLSFITKKIMNTIVVNSSMIETFIKSIVEEHYNIKQVYKSKVLCLPEDVWDKNKGKRLALLKVNMEYKKDMVKLFKKLFSIFNVMFRNVDSLSFKFSNSLTKDKVSYCSGK